MATATAPKRSIDFRDHVPMSREAAVNLYLSEIGTPKSVDELDLKEAMEILGLSIADYHAAVCLQKSIVDINRRIDESEKAGNDASASLTAELGEVSERRAAVHTEWLKLNEAHNLLMVKLSAADGKALALKTERGRLVQAQRAAEDRLRQPAQPGMSFPQSLRR
jgi:hypothetical protein